MVLLAARPSGGGRLACRPDPGHSGLARGGDWGAGAGRLPRSGAKSDPSTHPRERPTRPFNRVWVLACDSVRVVVSVLEVAVVDMTVRVGLSVVTVFDMLMIVQNMRVSMGHIVVRVLMIVLCCGH